MTPQVFLRSLPSAYYSLNITGTIIVVLYIIIMDVTMICLGPISCRKDGRHTIVDWPSDLLCREMKGHWNSLYEKHVERYKGTVSIRHHDKWDICCLRTYMWDIHHLWMHMWYMPMEERAMLVVILHDIGMCQKLSGIIAMDYTCVWLIIHPVVDVVCLLDYYVILSTLSVTCMIKLFFYLGLIILKPALYDHSLSYTHFVVP